MHHGSRGRTAEQLAGDRTLDVPKKKKRNPKKGFKFEGQLSLHLVGDAVESVAAFPPSLP